jgi:hypothetical protein
VLWRFIDSYPIPKASLRGLLLSLLRAPCARNKGSNESEASIQRVLFGRALETPPLVVVGDEIEHRLDIGGVAGERQAAKVENILDRSKHREVIKGIVRGTR